MENTEKILKQFMKLPPLEKANIIDQLLKSLDEPDPSVDKLWVKESENRINAYESGKLKALTDEEFFNMKKS
ncbi:putative addiction module component, TIGR02574 family [Belliella baltica DSM 15883]|jgi:putative addiction module component (TIGR02574 family)|uniref:Putative addiction module component, TIGR02574 family n=1 Tax=Belliella baltica (strain DSM 15883 / CIP 108006 / LMG 21964 / BA134) TaxID=866536 RepID=I3Z6R4_BELBD|nr:addiction module protein [Belliella baltica]AFL84932.1 putative addiction module component, TIGR02574 family [Belliella baltica DSM 15883]